MFRKLGRTPAAAGVDANHDAFEEVCALLHAGHAGDGPAGTLNRLFCKNLQDLESDLPVLTSQNTRLAKDIWAKQDIRALAPRASSREPHRDDIPVVIFRFRGRTRLLDGGSRAHKWHKAGDTGTHQAWVLTITEQMQTTDHRGGLEEEPSGPRA